MVKSRFSPFEPVFAQTKVYAIRTKEKSVWSGQHIFFYFKSKKKAEEFMYEFNRYPDIDIEFEPIGETEENDTRHLQIEIGRDTYDYVDYWSNWGRSFTAEHKKLKEMES